MGEIEVTALLEGPKHRDLAKTVKKDGFPVHRCATLAVVKLGSTDVTEGGCFEIPPPLLNVPLGIRKDVELRVGAAEEGGLGTAATVVCGLGGKRITPFSCLERIVPNGKQALFSELHGLVTLTCTGSQLVITEHQIDEDENRAILVSSIVWNREVRPLSWFCDGCGQRFNSGRFPGQHQKLNRKPCPGPLIVTEIDLPRSLDKFQVAAALCLHKKECKECVHVHCRVKTQASLGLDPF